MSWVYVLGFLVESLGSIPFEDSRIFNSTLCVCGLIIIACGNGGIKPCIISLGSDQLAVNDEKNRSKFYSIHYWTVNLAFLVSVFISPILRGVDCGKLGDEDTNSCYFLVYSMTFVFMILATLIFILGRKYYTKLTPSGKNIFYDCLKIIFYGIFYKVSKKSPKKDSWLYGAYGKSGVDTWLINDTKYLIRIIVLFSPLPIFWGAFYQQNSKWVLQALTLDGYIGDTVHILPDQAPLLNAFFIITFIPVVNLRWIFSQFEFFSTCSGKLPFP